MLRSFRSRPSVQRFLAAPGPVVLYSLLAGLLAWASASSGWHSAGAFVFGLLSVVCGLVAAQEVRFCLTGRWPPGW